MLNERYTLEALSPNLLHPLSPNFLANPYPFYHSLRSGGPVQWGSLLEHTGWFVTGYKEASFILKDARFKARVPIPPARNQDAISSIWGNTLLFKNPPDHMRLRSLIHAVFASCIAEDFLPYIQETADNLLSRIEQIKKMDLVADFAFLLPSLVIARVLGIPADDHPLFQEWSNTIIEAIDLTRTTNTLHRGKRAIIKLAAYFQELITDRMQRPQNDLITKLIIEGERQGRLNHEEVLAACILMLIAGHETTVNLIGNSMLALLRHPNALKTLREQPSLIPSTVEECLRYDSPTQLTARTASETVSIGGVTIKKGQHVYILLGAANRDPNKFQNPDQLDITRSSNHHLAFGSGIHVCLGSSLARTEAQIAIHTLLNRFSDLQLETDDPQWRKLFGFRSLEALPVSFTR